MPILNDYRQFAGRHWETGSLHNHWDYRGYKAPHSQQPYSEALLLGISGGIVMGYFSFAYEGYDPHVSILTRNTFDPLDTILTRLGVEQNLRRTTNSTKALRNLFDSLDEGIPPLVWADQYTLPYNALPLDAGMWHMAPLVVYGYDQSAATVTISDRASLPLTTTTTLFDAARSRIKEDKHCLLTLERPDEDKLRSAVSAGIWDCINLFTEKPPKGSRNNFGFAAYQRWAELLTNPKQRLSWVSQFPAGRKMLAGLTSSFTMIALYGQDGTALDAERSRYADFLIEAASILEKPALTSVSGHFRHSSDLWRSFALQLLPDTIPALKETRELLIRRHCAFIERGNGSLEELQQIDSKMKRIQEEVTGNFPLTTADVTDFRQQLASRLQQLCNQEQIAVESLKNAMQ